MEKSEKDKEIEALKAELRREQAKNAKLREKHESDKHVIKNLKRRKDHDPKKKDRKRKPREIRVTEEQRLLLSNLLQGIDILS